jgi:hypothetical protein
LLDRLAETGCAQPLDEIVAGREIECPEGLTTSPVMKARAWSALCDEGPWLTAAIHRAC